MTEGNAHPHSDADDRVHIVLNGIVENHVALRERLVAEGAEFTSETDAEVVAHLIAQSLPTGDLVEASALAYGELRGHYAFVAMCADEPEVLVGARKECPLVVGVGEDEHFIASAIPAFLAADPHGPADRGRRDGGPHARAEPSFLDAAGDAVERDDRRVDWDENAAEKGGFETFMLKEIHEQADAVAETIADRVPGDARRARRHRPQRR